MMRQNFVEEFEDCPVVAAIKDDEGLERCLGSEIRIVFVLYGDICTVGGIVDRLKQSGKLVLVHVDLVGGLGSREVAVDYIRSATKADGIISTRPALIRRARELGLFAVMRFFVLDSMALENVKRQIETIHPDMIEIMPGLMPKIIRRVCSFVDGETPVITGGLITDREDVVAALNAGAVSVSTTRQETWFM